MDNEKPENDPTIVEYQRRRKELQPKWNRNVLFLALPALLLFGWAGETGRKPLALVAFGVFAAAGYRGWRLWSRYRRCPECDAVQGGGLRFPYLSCRECGVRLSIGAKDSW